MSTRRPPSRSRFESAAIATTVALTTRGRLFASLDEWWSTGLYAIGLALLLIAAALAALVVIPWLRRSKVDVEARDNFVYFGHVRLWEPGDLEDALRDNAMLAQLSRQIVVMARIAWTKHVRMQWSFSLAMVGAASLTVCGLLLVT